MRVLRWSLLVCGLVFGVFARAEVPPELASLLAPLDSLAGEFKQTTLSAEGEVLEESRGSFRLLRPSWFSWHIQEPEEQLLVASAGSLWHYDVELETATRRSLDPASPTNPMTILGGETAVLADHYQIEALADAGWRLSPRFETADFETVVLFFADGLPGRMLINDALGRQSVILFVDPAVESSLTAADFEFSPPAGVDIYDSGI